MLDLRDAASRRLLLALLAAADVLIDPFRPGVLERLGLAPASLQQANPRLVAHDGLPARRQIQGHSRACFNYIAVSGVLSMLGRAGELPHAPGNIVGDFAGGGAMCFVGILLARVCSGRGQVVEANMVDGSAYHLATMPRLAREAALWSGPRGTTMLDGGSPFYSTYETKDAGRYFAVGSAAWAWTRTRCRTATTVAIGRR